VLLCSAIASYQQEIDSLKSACSEHEKELYQMNSLLAEETQRTLELEEVKNELDMAVNDLQIDAKAFDSIHRQLTLQCISVQREVAAVSRVQLTSVLFTWSIDHERGLRFPLINELRLAFRPKGDLTWNELNAAWSQAAQFLFYVAGVVKFASDDIRIVPLTCTCAKLFCITKDNKRSVHNLGKSMEDVSDTHGSMSISTAGDASKMASALRALNALIYQIVQHVVHTHCTGHVDISPPPFEMSRNTIGTSNLYELVDKDDSGWGYVIHFMACNLKWLSDNANRISPSKLPGRHAVPSLC
jgi:hypothetical protein